jgi:hypothetical protein
MWDDKISIRPYEYTYYVSQLITPDHEEIEYAVLNRSGR